MEKSLCEFLDIKKNDFNHLYNDIYNSPDKEPWQFISDYINDRWNKKNFDKVQFYHLTRRLNGSDLKECTNLKDLLTTENVFSSFLRNNNICFKLTEEGTIDLYFRDKKIPLSYSGENPMPNLASRLQKDFCVNGFAIRDSLEKEENGYYQSLTGCPEFISVLDEVLHLSNRLCYSYLEVSKSYCIEYVVPIREVIIDGGGQQDTQQAKTIDLLNSFVNHLYDQWVCSLGNADCVVLRLQDNVEMNSEYFVRAEEL